ncbi:MAG: 23S rRNA (uracil(1939)-C(5))-methyltransferase RlmD, partial [Chitinophagales bacterium]
FIAEQIENIHYQLGPNSFFQTNTEQAKNLYRIAMDMANLQKTDLVFDLYTGLGSIALLIAGRCRRVVGVETVESAVDDARKNALFNGVHNCEFVCGNMDKIFNADFIATYGKPDVIITDPPRAGMHKDVVAQILDLAPRRIVYISCNPATQARDIHLLSAKYRVEQLQPVDMFPHTFHIENIALLARVEACNN